MESVFKKLQSSNNIEDIKSACDTFASLLKFDNFNISIAYQATMVHPPLSVFTNLKNTRSSFSQMRKLTQICYLHTQPVFFNDSHHTLQATNNPHHRATYSGAAFPVHTTTEYFTLLSLHFKKPRFISASGINLMAMQGSLFARHLTERILDQLHRSGDNNKHLNNREIRYLKQIASGERREEIARRENVSTCTIAFHILRAKRKLNAKTSSQAVAKASLMGYFTPKF